MRFAVACLAVLAVASVVRAAEKQITLAPPPPPTTTAITPAMELGYYIPGYTSSTFGSAQITTLCNALIAAVQGYNQAYMQCLFSSANVVDVPVSGVYVNGILNWAQFAGMTDADKAAAASSRTAYEAATLQNQGSYITTAFPGAKLNAGCNPTYNGLGSQTFPINGIPFASCAMSPNVGAADSSGSVGIDNGKTCPSGPQYIIPATPSTTSNLAGPGKAITCQAALGGTTTCTSTATPSGTTIGQGFTISLAGGDTSANAGCTNAQIAQNLLYLNNNVFVVSATTNAIPPTFSFQAPGITACNSGSFSVGLPSSATLTMTGQWSPLCDSDFQFYLANSQSGSGSRPAIGYVCPSCTNNQGTGAVLFSYAGPNKGKLCSNKGIASPGVNEQAYSVLESLMAGQSCVQIGADTSGQAALLQPLPVGVTIEQVMPGMSSYVTVNPSANPVALDTQFGNACSTPSLVRVPSSGATLGVPGKGLCNVAVLFSNGGTGPGGNGINPDTDRVLVLNSAVASNIVPYPPPPVVPSPPPASPSPSPVPQPSPSPSPEPQPSPSPEPQPSPSPMPRPSPNPKPRCTWSGTYTIAPTLCTSKYLAFNRKSCKDTSVTLKKINQLGNDYNRRKWLLDTDSFDKSTNIQAFRDCAADNLSAPNSNNPMKLGGSAWTYQVKATAKSCSVVNLVSRNRAKAGKPAFLAVDKTCSKFSWGGADGVLTRFTLKKR